MIIPDAKKATSVILSRLGKDGAPNKEMPIKNEADGPEMPSDEGLTAAAQDMMQAFHDKSIHGLVSGMKAFIDQYEPSDSDDQEE
jgi:hypothetical protein